MRIGVFGGAFDPPHAGHVAVCHAALTELHLDRILWVPTFHPAHRDAASTPFDHRMGMVQALIRNINAFEISDIEAALPPPSYSLNTLRALKSSRQGMHEWYLLVGADNWAIFPTWHQPETVLAEATLVVYPRQSIPLTNLPPAVIRLNCPEISWESRQLRASMQHDPLKTLSRLPRPVADYIQAHGLYNVPGISAHE